MREQDEELTKLDEELTAEAAEANAEAVEEVAEAAEAAEAVEEVAEAAPLDAASIYSAIDAIAAELGQLAEKIDTIINTLPAALDAGNYLAPQAEAVNIENDNATLESLGLAGVVEDMDLL